VADAAKNTMSSETVEKMKEKIMDTKKPETKAEMKDNPYYKAN